ncbi:MAG TPA: hypothetical protein VEB22_02950 [Phycisphaerales bacterium]|nr:hypothetical protein [Phycisphaerales bacterium]
MRSHLQSVATAAAIAGWAGTAAAQDHTLRPEQVLVVYDQRIASSLAVAEYYAGSAKVPGGAGNLPGVHPGVKVIDMGFWGPVAMTPDITYTQFKASFRTPLRTWLNTNDPLGRIRCIVLTKGIPHRIQDTDSPVIGDDPLNNINEFSAGDVNCASVDSELSLLQMNLDNGENGSRGDSYADGMIINPYHDQSLPINAWPTRQRRNTRLFDWLLVTSPGTGVVARSRTVPSVQVLSPGDIYLVCRLDGHTVADVFAMIDRAQQNVVNADAAVMVLDESRSNGAADTFPNAELDNDDINDGATSYMRIGDDFERTRDQFLVDGRLAPTNILYNKDAAPAGYIVGPRINYGGGIVVSEPVAFVSSEATNTLGPPPGTSGQTLPLSFNWGPMGCYSSIESFNGRQFLGLSAWLGQSSIADALSVAGGAAFAVGNVYEPYAFTMPDSEVIARNFYRGRLSWAEAAWSSLPAISWQQIVVGDPLARVVLSCQDIDGNALWDANDLYAWEGTGVTARTRDVNRSGAADDADRRLVDPSPRPMDHVDMAGGQR